MTNLFTQTTGQPNSQYPAVYLTEIVHVRTYQLDMVKKESTAEIYSSLTLLICSFHQ